MGLGFQLSPISNPKLVMKYLINQLKKIFGFFFRTTSALLLNLLSHTIILLNEIKRITYAFVIFLI